MKNVINRALVAKKAKMILWAVLAATVLFAVNGCRHIPGSEQWYIQKAAKHCIKNDGLQAGEKLVFINGTQRQCACEWNGQPCQYVAVKYTVKKPNGSKTHRIVHMLMSENGKQAIEVSFDGKAEWVQGRDIDAVNEILNNLGL